MKNTFGNNVTITIFGESHGEAIGAVLDGMAPGIKIDRDLMDRMMELRKPAGKISTARRESDSVKIVSGVHNGVTTGTPITFVIENHDTKSSDYEDMAFVPRPGHADYSAELKYHGYQDKRGGGHFSGRITAAIVVAGAVAMQALNSKGIFIGTHISRVGTITDRDFGDYYKDIVSLLDRPFAVLDDSAMIPMKQFIELVASEGDSVGGILKTAVIGMPGGVGEPWFDSVESMLSHALFSIPAIKGVEFGDGFKLADMRGSEANDAYRMGNENTVITSTNHNGGINGGITNGMPIEFSVVVKPTPSIYKKQDSVDLNSMKDAQLTIEGRHDPAIIHRARIVVDAMTALALCDILVTRFGTDYLV